MRPTNDLEQLLSATPHLDDEGFTARVMARLPDARASTRSRLRLVLAASLCAALVGVVALPGSQAVLVAVRDVLEPLLAMPLDPGRAGAALTSTGATGLAVHGVLLVMIVWGAVALARSESR